MHRIHLGTVSSFGLRLAVAQEDARLLRTPHSARLQADAGSDSANNAPLVDFMNYGSSDQQGEKQFITRTNK